MKAKYASKFILKKFIDDFKVEGLSLGSTEQNITYLEEKLSVLGRMADIYQQQSIDKKLSPKHRARARDLHQNAIGLSNGIKFSLSFISTTEEDLSKMESQ